MGMGCGRSAGLPAPRASPAFTPQPSPSPSISPLRCARPFRPYGEKVPPVTLEALAWVEKVIGAHRIRQLGPSPRPLLPWGRSPDGRWLIVVIPQDEGNGSSEAAMIDRQGLARRWLNRTLMILSPYTSPSTFPLSAWTRWRGKPWTISWLADGEALWIDEQGRIWRSQGEQARLLPTPAPALWVEAGAEGKALALIESPEGTSELWRIHLPQERWERVSPPEAGGEIVGWEPKRTWALTMQIRARSPQETPMPAPPGATWAEATFWQVPLQEQAPARRLSHVTLLTVGTDAWMPPSQALRDGRLWVLGWPTPEGVGALVDVRGGRWLRWEDLGGSPTDRLITVQASPQGAWVAWLIGSAGGDGGQTILEIRQGDGLEKGWRRDGLGLVGWHPEDHAVVLGMGGWGPPDTLRPLMVLPLPPEGEPRLLAHAAWPVSFTRDRIVTRDSLHPARVYAFDLEGNLRDELDLSSQAELVRTIWGTGEAVYLDVGWTEGTDCRYSLIEWIPR